MPSRTSSPSVSSDSVPSRQPTPIDLSLAEIAKEGLIITACEKGDLPTLVHLATSTHGLVSDSLRRTAWPILLACKAADGKTTRWQDLPAHREEGQVGLDVNRAFVYYPKHSTSKAGISSGPHRAHYKQTQRRSSTAGNMSSPMSSSRCYVDILTCPTSRAITISSRSSTSS